MKTTIAPIAMFICLILFVSFANSSLLNLCDTITESTYEIEELVENDDFEAANAKSEEIINFIHDNTVVTAVYINHSDFDNFMDEAIELSIYTKCEDYMECLIAASSLREFSNNIRHLHEPTIENIF